jgi:hypothetical protein
MSDTPTEILRKAITKFNGVLSTVPMTKINKDSEIFFEKTSPVKSIFVNFGAHTPPKTPTLKGKVFFNVFQAHDDFIKVELYRDINNQDYRILYLKKFSIKQQQHYAIVGFSQKTKSHHDFDPWWDVLLYDTLEEAVTTMEKMKYDLTILLDYENDYTLVYETDKFVLKSSSPKPKAESPPKNKTASPKKQNVLEKAALAKMTIPQLKSYAQENNITIVGKLKADIVDDIYKKIQKPTTSSISWKAIQDIAKNKKVTCKVGHDSYSVE